MDIETYEIEEKKPGEAGPPVEVPEEARELITALDLSGQRELLKPPEPVELSEDEVTTRIPYPKLSKGEREVYKALCPHSKKVEDYSAAVLPVRILQVIEYARVNCLFEDLLVRYPKPFHARSHLLLGRNGTEWNGDYYLLAQWGETLLSYEAMKQEAFVLKRAEWQNKAASLIAECQKFLDRIDTRVEEALSGDYVSTPW